jgi:O-antigen ligase
MSRDAPASGAPVDTSVRTWLTLYLIALFAIPSRLVIAPLGSAGAISALVGLGSLAIWLLARAWSAPEASSQTNWIRIALWAFLFAVGVSYLLAMSHPIDGDEVSPADVALISLASWTGTLLLTQDGLRNRDAVSTMTWRLTQLGGLLAALGVAQFVAKQPIVDVVTLPGFSTTADIGVYLRDGRVRPSGTAHHPLEYGAILTILLPPALHIAFHRRDVSPILRWFPALTIAGVVAISSSRTAYLTAIIAVAICMIGWNPRQRVVIGGLSLAAVMGLTVAAPNLVTSVIRLFTGVGSDPSIESRTDSFDFAWTFFTQHPLFGRGLGTLLPKYRIFDNQYLLLFVTVGIVGTLLFLTLATAAIAQLVRTHRAATEAADKDLAICLIGSLAAGFTSLLFFDAFAFPMTMGTLFFVLGLSGAFTRLVLDDADRSTARTHDVPSR